MSQSIPNAKSTELPRTPGELFDLGPETSEVEGLFVEPLELISPEPTHEQILEWTGMEGKVVNGGATTIFNKTVSEQSGGGGDSLLCVTDYRMFVARWTWDTPDSGVVIPRGMLPHDVIYGYDIKQNPGVKRVYDRTKQGWEADWSHVAEAWSHRDLLADDPRFVGKELASPLFEKMDGVLLDKLKKVYEAHIGEGAERNRQTIEKFLRSIEPLRPILLTSERWAIAALERAIYRDEDGHYAKETVAETGILPENVQQVVDTIQTHYAQYCELSRLAEQGQVELHEAYDCDQRRTWVLDTDGNMIAPADKQGSWRCWYVGPGDVVISAGYGGSSRFAHELPMNGEVTTAQLATMETLCSTHGFPENAWGLDAEEAQRQSALVRYILGRASGYGLGRDKRPPSEMLEALFSEFGLVIHDSTVDQLYKGDGPLGAMHEPYMNGWPSDVLAEIPLDFTDAPDHMLYITAGRHFGMDWLIAKICQRMEQDEQGYYVPRKTEIVDREDKHEYS